jgi:hypothetical protein
MVGVRAKSAAVTAKAMAVFRNIDLSPPEAIHPGGDARAGG